MEMLLVLSEGHHVALLPVQLHRQSLAGQERRRPIEPEDHAADRFRRTRLVVRA